MKKKRTSKLEGSVVPLMNRLRDDKEMLRNYFYCDSPVWNALREHIYEGPCLVIEKPNKIGFEFYFVHDRASSPCHWKDAWTYGWQMASKAEQWSDGYMPDYYVLEFTVSFIFDGEERTEKYKLHIPFDLEDNFTQEKFDIWAKKVGEELVEEKKKKTLPELKRLVTQYPEEAKKMLGID